MISTEEALSMKYHSHQYIYGGLPESRCECPVYRKSRERFVPGRLGEGSLGAIQD